MTKGIWQWCIKSFQTHAHKHRSKTWWLGVHKAPSGYWWHFKWRNQMLVDNNGDYSINIFSNCPLWHTRTHTQSPGSATFTHVELGRECYVAFFQTTAAPWETNKPEETNSWSNYRAQKNHWRLEAGNCICCFSSSFLITSVLSRKLPLQRRHGVYIELLHCHGSLCAICG